MANDLFHEATTGSGWPLSMTCISIVTPCYNEDGNVRNLYEEVKQIMATLSGYIYEHIFIDNGSKDNTENVLRQIAAEDKCVKVILNTRNFGYTRSFQHALLQARGDAVIPLSADFQDPPNLIRDLVAKWEEGYKVVMGVKRKSEESLIIFSMRTLYYRIMRKLSEIELTEHYYGFGLYDQRVIQVLRDINDPYPYFRGLIAYIGFKSATVEYIQPSRKHGESKFNLPKLYDMAMLGLVSHSKAPLRLATLIGLVSATVSIIVGLTNLVFKLIFWDSFVMGLAPLAVGLFLIGSVQLFFLGIIGEYLGFMYMQIQHRPLVVEKERINFGD